MSTRNAIAILLICLYSCTGGPEEQFPDPIVRIPTEYNDIVQLFLNEAQARGHSIFIDNLIIETSLSAAASCGACNSNDIASRIQKTITIKTSACWDNNQQREALIFHELGHCVLGRVHDTNTLPNGDPKSLMVAGNIGVYSPCNYVIDEEECNFTYKRQYYIDELFDQGTPAPSWSK